MTIAIEPDQRLAAVLVGAERRLETPRIVALALVGVATVLRFWALGNQSLWYDEIATVLLARFSIPEIVTRSMQDTPPPPLHYILLHPWLQLGGGEFMWRFPSAWFGVLTVALVLRLGRILGGRQVGAAAAAVVAISPFFVYYSQEVRLYSFLTVVVIVYVLVLRTVSASRAALLGGILGAVALYSHPLAALVLPVPAVDSWLRRRSFPVVETAAVLIAGLLFAPWAPVLVAQGARFASTFWASPVSLIRPLSSLVVFAFGPPMGSLPLIAGLSLVLIVLGIGAMRMLRTGWPDGILLCALLTLLPPMALTILSQIRPIYIDRVIIGSAVGLALLIAFVYSTLPSAGRRLLALIWISLAAFGLVQWFTNPDAAKPPFREAAAYVASSWRQGDVVLHTGDTSHHAFLIYAPTVDNRLLAGDPEYAAGAPRGVWSNQVMQIPQYSLDHLGDSAGRIWVIIALDHSIDWQIEQAATIDERWSRTDERRFGSIVVREYAIEHAPDGR